MSWQAPFNLCEHDWAGLGAYSHTYNRFSDNNIRDLRDRANPWP
jgi:hypothetical protein